MGLSFNVWVVVLVLVLRSGFGSLLVLVCIIGLLVVVVFAWFSVLILLVLFVCLVTLNAFVLGL